MDSELDDGEAEGGGYLVSVSDLMIGLLFVFLLMLMAFALQYQTQAEVQKAKIEQQDRTNVVLERERREMAARSAQLARERDTLSIQLAAISAERKRVGETLAQEIDRIEAALRQAQAQRAALLIDLRDRLRSQDVMVEIDTANGVLRLPDGVLFRSLSADLPDVQDPAQPNRLSPRETVRRLAAALDASVPCYTIGAARPGDCPAEAAPILEAMFVEGHTDRRPIPRGSRFTDNHELSTARALSTYRALLADQPGLGDLRNASGAKLLGLSGYGEDRPVQDGDREEDLAANRRIDLRFLLASPPPRELNELRRSLGTLLQGGEH